MTYKFTNNATSTLASGITNVATTLTVAAGEGARFPTLGAGESFPVTVEEVGGMEIMLCTSRSGDVLTVTRGQEGTTARAASAGASVQARITRAVLESFVQDDGDTINGAMVISANTTADALRVTQTGAGNAFVVEDSANPDTTPFVVKANGDVETSGTFTIKRAAGQYIYLDTTDATPRQRGVMGLTNGLTRWGMFMGGSDAESGSNAGSSWSLFRYDDAGAVLGAAVAAANRATGNVAINNGAALADTRVYIVANTTADAVMDSKAIRVLNGSTDLNASVSIEFATAGGALRGAIVGRRPGNNNGDMQIYTATAGVLNLAATFKANSDLEVVGNVAISGTPTASTHAATMEAAHQLSMTRAFMRC